MIKIKKNQLNDFFKVPFLAYKGTPYISPFKSDIKRFLSAKNPLIAKYGELEYFVAYKDNIPVGRITAHIHHKSNELHNLKRGYFGYFDCIDDIEVARSLLDTVEKWHKKKGMNEVAGNFNLTAMQQMGVMTDQFHKSPYIDQLYSPEHIHKLLEKLGYEQFFPMNTYEYDITSFNPKVLEHPKIKSALENPDLKWGHLDKKQLKQQLKFACDLLNDGFKDNPMFVPLTFEEFWFQAKDMSLVIDTEITSFIYHKDEPAGVIITIPDLNPLLKSVNSKMGITLPFKLLKFKKHCKRCLLIFASVKQEFHSMGLGNVMLMKMLQKMKEKGYESMGVTWISDDNPAPLAMAKRIGALPYQRLHLYKKDLK